MYKKLEKNIDIGNESNVSLNDVLLNYATSKNFGIPFTFTEEEFISVWNDYIKTLHNKGEKIMASILEMDTPKLNETSIELEFPNETLKLELEKAQYPLMEYIRRTLKNYDLKLEISVNEEVAKQYVFTAKDKFEKLKEKNPNIELLKTTFGLDL